MTTMNAIDDCVRVNAAGMSYTELTCLYPAYGKTYFDFELKYNPVPVRDWMVTNGWAPIVAVVTYGALILAGRQYFEHRPAWNWRGTLALWNLGLSIFSFWGFMRTAPYVLHMLTTMPWRDTFCVDPETNVGSGTTGLWAQMFALSKFPELFDTFFIVVHKKPLIFLHWYHHISVLLFCWHAYVNKAPTGIIFCVMNYAVHAIMYFYYFLMAVHIKPKWFKPEWITMAQISQMILGVCVTTTSCYVLYIEKPKGCFLSTRINNAALLMYGSYLFLFLQFFLKRYYIGASKKKKL